ncbi:hypothetical protein HBH92_126810 [Parastagonospora nodorum]|nr:hypothetical protein HBH46_098300 [Parastagonospora nodorum]KAH4161876.1 hypothetical protein HBH43_165900 [Parastagonospora nodorum]KAH4410033.1 hypothetical protein HBH92_126810 [Parastagonospora nodorum]KAH4426724.1 hypothetical protein HBH93_171370 [Parastagonospora nodorum]KAH4441553.1 hypothetical protein HBH91_168890 [Parastagonospora nodorum]
MDASPGNRPPRPTTSPTDQPMYIRCDGQAISQKQFKEIFGPILQRHHLGQPVRQDLLREGLWMLAQHSPNHAVLKGKTIAIPFEATPLALSRLGYSHPRIQDWVERRDAILQQQQQQQQQQRPQAPQLVVPNMIPSASQTQAQRASHYSGSPPQVSIGQRMPSGSSYSPYSAPQSPARMHHRITTASSLNQFPHTAPQDGMGPRVPSTTSPQSPFARPQYQTSPGRPQDMRRPGVPDGAAQYMWPNSRNLPPRPSPSPTMGMFPPPLSRSNSVQSEAHRGKAILNEAEKEALIDNWLKRWMAMAIKGHPKAYTWALEMLGDKPNIAKKWELYKAIQVQSKANARQQRAQQLQSLQPQLHQPREVIDLTSNKRKDPPTASNEPPKKRQIVDLTQPRRDQFSNHEPQAPVLLDAPGGDKIAVVPIPELAATDDLQAHATIFGVNAHDLELNGPIFTSVQNSTPAPLPVPDHPARPHVNLVSAPKIHPDQDITIWIPDMEVAAAKAKINSGQYDFTWSNGIVDDVEPVTDELLEGIGCEREEDGLWRAPSPMLSEEKANVEWSMVSRSRERSFAP